MKGHVFECFEEQYDRRQFAKTRDALRAYVTKISSYPEDFAVLFDDEITEPSMVLPLELPENATSVEKAVWDHELKEFVKRKGAFKGTLAAIQEVILGQCSEDMKDRLKALPEYKMRTKNVECAWLLSQILAVTLRFDSRKNAFVSLMSAQRAFYNCKQHPGQSPTSYLEELRGWAVTITQQGASIAGNPNLIPANDESGNPLSAADRLQRAYEKSLAIALITGADPVRYGAMITRLSNRYAQGFDEYPNTPTIAFNLMVTYEKEQDARHQDSSTHTTTTGSASTAASTNPSGSGITFAQSSTVTGNNGVTHDDVECFRCHSYGHYASYCPSTNTNSSTAAPPNTTLTQHAYMMAQHDPNEIDRTWILLDSQSTISVFNNPTMLSNIRPSCHEIRVLTNGGHQVSNMIGEFKNLGTVWYNPKSIANILSLSEVRRVCRVTLDTSKESALCVHRIDGSLMKFIEHQSGLFVYATADPAPAYTLLETVAANKKLFTPRQVTSADLARGLYRKLGRPSEADFYSILTKNLIRNCPVTPDDARRAFRIYGPDVATLKGKMTRTTAAPRAPTFEAVPLSPSISEHHRNITLCVDFFFVQGIGFLHTISRGIGFRTVSPVTDRSHATIRKEIAAAIKLYTVRGLHVRDIHADQEFGCIREELRPIEMNLVTADAHVGEVERSIRTIKERLRSIVHGLPFRRIPRLMITHMVFESVRTLNQFPHPNGVSDTLSPASIVTGCASPDYSTMRLELGSYVQVFDDKEPTNTPRSRSLGAITLSPTGNAQGDYYFMSLATGARLSRHQYTELPLSDTAIARVEAIALQEGRPLIQERGFLIEWRPDHPIDDSEYDFDYTPPDHDPADDQLTPPDFDSVAPSELDDLLDTTTASGNDPPAPPPDQGAHIGGNNNEQPYNINYVAVDQIEPDPIEPHDDMTYDADDYNGGAYDDDDNDPQPPDNLDGNNDIDATHGQDEGAYEAHEANAEANEEDNEDVDEGAFEEQPRYNLRPRGQTRTNFNSAIDNPHNDRSYFPPTQLAMANSNQQDTQLDDLASLQRYAFTFIIKHMAATCTQMSERVGLRKHGKAAEEALMKEFTQLEQMNAYVSIDPSTLTNEQKRAALRALNLFKEKRNGVLKGRTCADGRPQRNMYDKSQTASPTVSTDALMLSIILEAYEGRNVATADVVGAYLKAYMDDFVIMKFIGASVRLLCIINPDYRQHVTIENGVEVLYVRLVKALYGCVKSALLWYDLFANNLKRMGFTLNPYDPCIANATIDDKQCTIAWYVDDAKISHEDPMVVTRVIEELENVFGKMTVTRGTEHVFLGMNIKYTKERTAVITMKEYLREAIAESGLEVTKSVVTPANRELFEVDEGATLLTKLETERFHSVTAKLLYVSLRARPDLLLPIAFLSTRVSKSTTQDQGKLQRVLQYIHGTMNLEYTIGADDLGCFRTWVDASYAVHPDMRSHTGGAMSFGRGAIICKSSKQKLNTKSSTEAEFVGASDYLPHPIWVKNFLTAQGYTVRENILEQDNESAIKLERNGRMSAGPKSRHIAIRYFWIKDRVKTENISIRHCPTLQMVADFFTKPLQGGLFQTFRDVIMGNKHMSSLNTDTPSMPLEERVEELQAASAEDDSISENDSDGTWVDVVKRGSKKKTRGTQNMNHPVNVQAASAHTRTRTRAANTTGVRMNSKIRFERSFSRNNPIE